ncbi:aminotransferase [Sphingomonas segetis]|uniref:aminotransferase n=1 Tax=Sphingomonas segetis TaxID=1104779 RepID=UPI001E530FE6|nr:aminotransferase [Sphingomonas segetis]
MSALCAAAMNPLYERMDTSVFERMSGLAAKFEAVNLGQGFPDFGWPPEILDAAATAVVEGSNQYAPSRGTMALRQAVAAHYNRHFGEELEAEQVCVTSGATEALGSAILATVQPGDEVLILTPAYDSYAPTIRRAGGTPVEVALQPPEWRIDGDALARAITQKTRAILFNNPHNPAGRLFGPDELDVIAALARDHDLIVISDEVWEHILLDGRRFTPLATLPGMAERTIKVGSAGKIFSLTGWKVGWIVAAPELAPLVARAHQFLTFSTAPNLQAAVAFGLNDGDAWLQPMRDRFQRSRDLMAEGLRAAGFTTLDVAATYFMCVDLAASGIALDDESFAAAAVEKAGVAVIPLSAFAERDPPRHLVRVCFSKKDETIEAGVAAMARAREMLA